MLASIPSLTAPPVVSRTAAPTAPVPRMMIASRVVDTSFSAASSGRAAMRTATVSRAEDAAAASGGTPVSKTTMLVVGSTGTLGRQIVRAALDDGYDVRCLVRPRESPADFLRDWGAKTISADLTDPASLPAALVGVHTVIDAATARPEQSIAQVDWEGKVGLIQSAQAMGIQRYIFFSIHDCDKYPEVPLMNIKYRTEQFLAESGLNYTTFRLCGLMQALIGNYAVPMLEERTVYGSSDPTKVAYLDTQDIAKMTMAALRRDQTLGQTRTLAGKGAFSVDEVIEKCERMSNSTAEVSRVNTTLLNVTRGVLSFFGWTQEAADRLAFTDVLSGGRNISADMKETYELLGMDESQVTELDDYLQQYFSRILKKLKDVGAESKQTNFYV